MALSKKAKKIILIGAAVVVGLPLILLLVVILKLNSIVKWGVEAGGTRTLGVPVHLQKVDISLMGESVTLNGLDVGNPEGFTTPSMVKVGGIHVAANVRALMHDEVHVRDITITDPEFTIEMAGTSTNIGRVMDNLKQGESAPAETPAPEEEKPQAKGPEMKLKIDHLLLSGVKVRAVGMGQDEVKTFPRIEISDIADANGNAVPVSKVVQMVLRRVSAEAMARGLNKAMDKELKKLGMEGSSAGETVKEEAGKLINIFTK